MGLEAGLNLYQYVASQPISDSDPTGNQSLDSVTGAVKRCLELPTPVERIECLDLLLDIKKLQGNTEAVERLRRAIESQRELIEHFRKLREAIARLKEMEQRLPKTSGKKAQDALKKEIGELLKGPKGIKGHIKEIKQKWGSKDLEKCPDTRPFVK